MAPGGLLEMLFSSPPVQGTEGEQCFPNAGMSDGNDDNGWCEITMRQPLFQGLY